LGLILRSGFATLSMTTAAYSLARGSSIFDFAAFMLYADTKKQATPEPVIKPGRTKTKKHLPPITTLQRIAQVGQSKSR